MNIFKRKKESYKADIKDSELTSWYIYHKEIPIFTSVFRFEYDKDEHI